MLLAILLMATAQDTTATQPAPPAKPERICRSVAVTGSRIGRRKICKTKEEWAQNDRQGGDMDVQRSTGRADGSQ